MGRIWWLLCIFPMACVKKTGIVDETIIFDEICRIEAERHGDGAFDTDFTRFGNVAMDRYGDFTRSVEPLWTYFRATEGVCRGALLQLLLSHHAPFMLENWRAVDRELTDLERQFLLQLIRQQKHPYFSEWIVHLLTTSPDVEVRVTAAGALATVDQATHGKTIQEVLATEENPVVIATILLALDLAKHPELGKAMAAIPSDSAPIVHETAMQVWASSPLPGKSSLIGRYLDHPDRNLAEMARYLMDRLEEKDRLSWEVVPPPGTSLGLKAGDALPEVDPEIRSAFLVAVSENDLAKMSLILDKGLDLNRADSVGLTLFHRALREGDAALIGYLLDRGAEIHGRTPRGDNALMLAARDAFRHGPEKLRLLIERGLDVNAVNDSGETALLQATMGNRVANVQTLIEMGADPSIRDDLGRTPLSLALLMEHDQIAGFLESLSKRHD